MLLSRLNRWLSRLVAEVPPDIAFCECYCRKLSCPTPVTQECLAKRAAWLNGQTPAPAG